MSLSSVVLIVIVLWLSLTDALPVQPDAAIADYSINEQTWTAFKMSFHKTYVNNSRETFRRKLWETNIKYITAHNNRARRGEVSYTLAPNEFSDLTIDEQSQQLLGVRVPRGIFEKPSAKLTEALNGSSSNRVKRQAAPASVDWTAKGYVTPVERQGSCGACYAFVAAGAIEGQIFRQTGKLEALSKQEIIDCSRNDGNQGCSGGWMNYAFNYVRRNSGIDKASYYPYSGLNLQCRFSRSTVGGRCTGYQSVSSGNEESLKSAVASVGPISVAVDGSRQTFISYSGGIYSDQSCSQSVNHAMLLVGYGSQSGTDYWLLKNSWGTSWGSGGYMKLARNRNNLCGVASYASYPTV